MGIIYTPKRKHKGKVKIVDPQPVWEVTVQKEGHNPQKLYMSRAKAERYYRAGFPVKLKTTAGELQQY